MKHLPVFLVIELLLNFFLCHCILMIKQPGSKITDEGRAQEGNEEHRQEIAEAIHLIFPGVLGIVDPPGHCGDSHSGDEAVNQGHSLRVRSAAVQIQSQ